MKHRRRFKQNTTLQDRVTLWCKQLQEKAAAMPPGPEREALIKKARQADVANHLEEWLKSPGLQRPTLARDDL